MRSYFSTQSSSEAIPGLINLVDQFDYFETTGTVTRSNADQYLISQAHQNITLREEERVNDFSRSLYKSLFKRPIRFLHSFILSSNIFTEAINQSISTLVDSDVKSQTVEILSLLDENIKMFSNESIPPIYLSELEDNSVIVEWIAQPFRLGFNIEKDRNETGYFLVSDKLAGGVRQLGNLNGLDLDTVIKSLLILIIGNLKAEHA